MEAVSAPARREGFWDRFLPLRHWLSAEAAGGLELGQAKTRLICTLAGVGGFVVMGRFASLPDGIVATAIVFPLYALAYLILVYKRPAPTRARRGFAILMDNLVGAYVAYFGGGFAAYVGFLFLTTVGWGLRFGRHYLFLATAIAILGMVWNLAASPYWQEYPLFGPNRPYFRERLAQMLAAAARNGRQVALLLFDIDGFKAVNDTLGHEAGDRVLQEIAERVGRRVRQADTFARVGGDEFVILMDIAHGKSDAIPVAETVVAAVSEIDMFAEQGLRVGASVGIACSDLISARERIADELLIQADRAMYGAKRAGKGCYRFAGDDR